MAASLSQYRNAVTLVHHVIPRRERGEILKIIKVIQSVAEISAIAAGLPCKSRHGPSREWHPERWPSGLRRTLGKRVCGKLYRGFESHSLRQQVIDIAEIILTSSICPTFPTVSVRIRENSKLRARINPDSSDERGGFSEWHFSSTVLFAMMVRFRPSELLAQCCSVSNLIARALPLRLQMSRTAKISVGTDRARAKRYAAALSDPGRSTPVACGTGQR
jgi:hypothetical protein